MSDFIQHDAPKILTWQREVAPKHRWEELSPRHYVGYEQGQIAGACDSCGRQLLARAWIYRYSHQIYPRQWRVCEACHIRIQWGDPGYPGYRGHEPGRHND